MHILSRLSTHTKEFLIIEGESYWPNGAGHGANGLVFADRAGGADQKMFSIGQASRETGVLTFEALNDDVSLGKRFLDIDYVNNAVYINRGSADVDIELYSDNKSALKIDAGTDKIYSELLNDGKSGTPPTNFGYVICNTDTDELSVYTPA